MFVRITDTLAVNTGPGPITKIEGVPYSDASSCSHILIHFIGGDLTALPEDLTLDGVLFLLNERTPLHGENRDRPSS